MRLPTLAAAAALLMLAAAPARATGYTWVGNVSSEWSNPQNWRTGDDMPGVPGAGDTASITNTGGDPDHPEIPDRRFSITLNGAYSVAGLTMATQRIDGTGPTISGGSLTVTGQFSFSAGTLFVMTLACPASCSVGIGGSFLKSLAGVTFVNDGTVTWSDSRSLRIQDSIITNNGTFALAADGLFAEEFYGGTFINRGAFEKTGGGTTTLGSTLVFRNEGGTVRAAAGTLALAGSTGGGATVSFRGGTRVEGAGTVRVAGTTDAALWDGTTTVTGHLELAPGGRIAGVFAVAACDGCFRWTGGALAFSPAPPATTMTILPGSYLDIESVPGIPQAAVAGANITNLGTVRWHGPNPLRWQTGTFTNEGTLELIGAGQALYSLGSTVVNHGLILRDGTGTTTLDGPADLRNEGGTIRVAEGTLSLASPADDAMSVAFLGGSRVEGAGLLRVRNGGSTEWAGATTITGHMELAGGSYIGDFTLAACDGCLRWTAGTLRFGPTVPTVMRIPGGGFLDIDGPADKAITGASMVNAGTTRWHDGDIRGLDGAIINQGRFEAAAGRTLGATFLQSTPGASFATGAGLDTLHVQYDMALSAGTVEVQVGPDGRSDRLDAGGNRVTLGAALIVTPAEPVTLAAGDAFTFIHASNPLVGTLAGVTAFGLGDVTLTPSYAGGDLRLTAGAGTGSPALVVAPNPVLGGAVRTLNVGGVGFTAATTARLDCAGCIDPAGHATIPATITSRTDTRLTLAVDLSDLDAFGGYAVVVSGAGSAPLAVLPVPLSVALAVTDASAAEDGHEPGRLTLTANRLADGPRSILYTLGGTAQDYTDYTTDTPHGRVILPAGRRSVDIAVIPLQDALAEPTETVVVTLAPGSTYGLAGPLAGTVAIADGRSTASFFAAASFPATAGADGSTVLRVVGQAFAPGASVALQGPAALAGTMQEMNGAGTLLSAVFNLAGAPLGTYDVVVTNGDGAAQTLAGAFTVEAPVAPDLSVSVTGPSYFRPGQVSRYTVTVTNRGNVDAVAVPAWVAITNDAGPVLQTAFEQPDLLEPPAGFPGWADIPATIDTLGHTTMPLFLAVVPAGESVVLPFDARASHVSAWVTQPMLTSLVPGAPRPAAFGSTLALVNPDDLEDCLLNVGGLVLDFLPGVQCAGDAAAWLGSAAGNLYGAGSSASRGNTYGAAGNGIQMLAGLAGVLGSCAGEVVPAFKIISVASRILSGAVTLQSCAKLFNRTPGDDQDAAQVSSHDPNDKLGPDGAGPERYRTALNPFTYTVRFENDAAATAPAAEVVVVDMLDPAVFDLSTFRLGGFAYGDSTLALPPGLTAYADESVLPNGLLLQTTASLDAATGRLVWRFTALDPVTRQIPADPTLGFLPPNAAPPQGEGSVTFTVRPRQALATGVPIANRASIVFDANDPIETPAWINALDSDRPASAVQPFGASQPDSSFTVRWAGSDVGAGVAAYDVYVQQNGGPFRQWLAGVEATEAVYPGTDGASYGFYAIARDGAGNTEPPKTQADATTRVVVGTEDSHDLPRVFSLEPNRPNPFGGTTTLRFGLPTPARVTLTLYDVLGREVARIVDGADQPAGWHEVQFDGRSLASGMYICRISAGDFTAVRRLTIAR